MNILILCRALLSTRATVLALSIAASLGFLTAPAAATTYQVTFSASGFSPSAPVPVVTGHFELTLDPAHDTSANVKVGSLNIPSGPIGFDYFTNGTLYIGGLLNSVDSIALGTNDFYLLTRLEPGVHPITLFGYTDAGHATEYWDTTAGFVNVTVSPAPIPAALPLFASALGGLGFVGWRRRQNAA